MYTPYVVHYPVQPKAKCKTHQMIDAEVIICTSFAKSFRNLLALAGQSYPMVIISPSQHSRTSHQTPPPPSPPLPPQSVPPPLCSCRRRPQPGVAAQQQRAEPPQKARAQGAGGITYAVICNNLYTVQSTQYLYTFVCNPYVHIVRRCLSKISPPPLVRKSWHFSPPSYIIQF